MDFINGAFCALCNCFVISCCFIYEVGWCYEDVTLFNQVIALSWCQLCPRTASFRILSLFNSDFSVASQIACMLMSDYFLRFSLLPRVILNSPYFLENGSFAVVQSIRSDFHQLMPASWMQLIEKRNFQIPGSFVHVNLKAFYLK